MLRGGSGSLGGERSSLPSACALALTRPSLLDWQAKDMGEKQQMDTVKSMLERGGRSILESVDLVIRIGCSLQELGIKVDESGTIKEAPTGLFDQDYTVVGINGKRFKPNLREQVLASP